MMVWLANGEGSSNGIDISLGKLLQIGLRPGIISSSTPSKIKLGRKGVKGMKVCGVIHCFSSEKEKQYR